jgi:hypothetical protein
MADLLSLLSTLYSLLSTPYSPPVRDGLPSASVSVVYGLPHASQRPRAEAAHT